MFALLIALGLTTVTLPRPSHVRRPRVALAARYVGRLGSETVVLRRYEDGSVVECRTPNSAPSDVLRRCRFTLDRDVRHQISTRHGAAYHRSGQGFSIRFTGNGEAELDASDCEVEHLPRASRPG